MAKRSMLRTIAVLVGLMLIVSLSFTGCEKKGVPSDTNQPESKKTEATEKPAEEKGLKGDFKLQLFVGGYGDAFWKEVVEGFKKENPSLNVDARMGPKINEQMKTEWINDTPPDFVYCDGPELPSQQLEIDGKFMDLTEFFNTAKAEDGNSLIKDHLTNGLLVEKNGKILQAPYVFGTWGVWYDQKLFNDNGVTPPTNFDELLKLGETLKAKNTALIAYTGVYSIYMFRGMILQALVSEGGQQLFDDVIALKPGVFTSAPFKKVIQKVQTLAEKGYFMKGTVALNHTQSQMEWLNRKAALIPNGLWLESEMKKDIPADFDMKFTPSVLQDAGQKYGVIPESIGMAISTKAKNPDAAKAFLTYLYKESVVKRFVELSGSPSVYTVDASALSVSEATKSVQKWLSDPNVLFVPKKDNLDSAVEKVASDGLNSIVLGNLKTDEYCNRLQKEADRVLAEKSKK